jgi:putative ABC transport system substrate-binding protein
MRRTRRNLLTRLAQAGLLAAGLELSVACDRLPGQAARVPRIGFVANQGLPGDPTTISWMQALITGLGDYGYSQGQNLQMDSRFPADATQNADMISDLLRSGVDVLVTGGTVSTQAAKQATSTVPIVGLGVGDPVGSGLVQNLARPGGNVTGISQGSDFSGKWLELLVNIDPTLLPVGYLYNPGNVSHVTTLERFSPIAAASGLETLPAGFTGMADLDTAFENAVASGAEAFIWFGFLGLEGDTRVAALSLSHRLVCMGVNSSYAMAGGLISYSADYIALFRRGGYYVDRILKGSKPADLPVEYPTTFDLVVNQATAKALGVTIPEEVAQQVTSWIDGSVRGTG